MSNPLRNEINSEMNAVEISKPGGPEVLVPVRRPVPGVRPGEVLIRVVSAGVNGPDIMQRKGLYPPPEGASDLPGLEVSGEVVVLGEGVTSWPLGALVTALTNGGGYAEYCAVDARHCLPIPQGVSLQDAGGLPETCFTVWSNIFHGVGLKAGETLLVHGGAGGIGATAVQLGKAFGARVVATDSPRERCDFVRGLGADRVVDFREEDFVEVMRGLGGANVILDIVGGPNIERNFKAAAYDARIVQLAFNAGSKLEINLMPVMLKRLHYTGSTLRTRPAEFKAIIANELRQQVWPKIAEGSLRMVTSKVFPLNDAAAAHALMESGGHTGKILLSVSPS